MLRWTAAVATAIRVAATSHLAPQTDAAQKVHALLAYYSEELVAAGGDKHPRKAKKASAVVGAVAVNAEQLMEQAAALAVKGILNPKEWVESSVLALVCGILQLPLAVLTVADQADISKWYVLPLFETKADYSQQIVADAVRLAVPAGGPGTRCRGSGVPYFSASRGCALRGSLSHTACCLAAACPGCC